MFQSVPQSLRLLLEYRDLNLLLQIFFPFLPRGHTIQPEPNDQAGSSLSNNCSRRGKGEVSKLLRKHTIKVYALFATDILLNKKPTKWWIQAKGRIAQLEIVTHLKSHLPLKNFKQQTF